MWKRRHVVSEKNLADFDSRLADEGLLTPGECLHPSQLLRRLSRDGRFRRDLGGTHPPALKPLPTFPEENQVPATAPAVPAPPPADTCTYDVTPCRARDDIPDVRLVSDTVHVPLQRRLSVIPRPAQCGVHAPDCSRGVPSASSRELPQKPEATSHHPVPILPILQPPARVAAGRRSSVDLKPKRVRGRYFLEIFAGCSRLSGALLEQGLRVGAPIDSLEGPHMDLLNPRIASEVFGWVKSGLIWGIWLGTPCSRWSVARTAGRAGTKVDVCGLACAHFTRRIVDLCLKMSIPFAIENPRSSGLWTWPPLRRLLSRSCVQTADFPMCRYGACYLKPTRLMGTLPDLESLGGGCTCQLPHEHLQGMAVFEDSSGKRTSIWKTSLAGRYPPLLCRAAARLISRAAPASGWRSGDEPPIARSWRRRLGAAIAALPPEPEPPPPRCPRAFQCDWDSAVRFTLTNDSRERRAAAVRRLAGRCGG